MEQYLTELSPELQERARQCRSKDELYQLLAEYDVELSSDALEAVAGGGSCTNVSLTHGQKVNLICPECGNTLYYWDRTWMDGDRYYCKDNNCVAHKKQWLFNEVYGNLHIIFKVADSQRRRSFK